MDRVKRITGDRRKLQAISKVSRAVWPESIQWTLATSKAAQWRRLVILRFVRRSQKQTFRLLSQKRKSLCPQRSQRSQRSQRPHPPIALRLRTHKGIIICGFIIAALLVICLVQRWYALLILSALCISTNIIVLYLLCNEQNTLPPSLPRRSPVAWPRIPGTTLTGRTLPSLSFPETPMPATPLIRVLETIDLSSTSVEHFLDLSDQPPSSQPSQEQVRRPQRPK